MIDGVKANAEDLSIDPITNGKAAKLNLYINQPFFCILYALWNQQKPRY